MSDDNVIKKFLTWAGIAAIVAIPVMVYLRKKRDDVPASARVIADDTDIFAAELEE